MVSAIPIPAPPAAPDPAAGHANSPASPPPPTAAANPTASPSSSHHHPITSSPPPPPLSPQDSSLLSALIRTNFDLAQVAFDHGLGLHELTDWLRSPAIQSLIADLIHSSQAILELRLARARAATVGILESIALTSDDPTERRRAATALFHKPFARPKNPTYRLYKLEPTPRPPPFTEPPSAPSAPTTDSPSSPAGGGPAALGGEGGFLPSTFSTNSPISSAPSPAPHAPITDSPSSPAGGGPAALGGGGGFLSSTSPTHAPISNEPHSAPQPTNPPVPTLHHLITSSLHHHPPRHLATSTPSAAASSLFNAFFTRNTKALLHAFSCHSTRDATLDGRPLLTALPTHPLAQMHISREVSYAELARTDTTALYTFSFDRAPLSPARASYRFHFTRDPAAADWLIHQITTLDSS